MCQDQLNLNQQMANQLLNRTLKCPKCKQFFFSYDGAEVCDICSFEQDEQDIVQEFKHQHDEMDDIKDE